MPGKARHSNTTLRGHVKDLDHCIRELTTARGEIADAIAQATVLPHRYQRLRMLAEPMARLRLVSRYIDDMIDANEVPA